MAELYGAERDHELSGNVELTLHCFKKPVKPQEKTLEFRIGSDNFSTKTLRCLDSYELVRPFRKGIIMDQSTEEL